MKLNGRVCENVSWIEVAMSWVFIFGTPHFHTIIILSCYLSYYFPIAIETRPNSLIDTIASNKGYIQNNCFIQTYGGQRDSLSYLQSRDAITSNN